jgi:hypothetical protein
MSDAQQGSERRRSWRFRCGARWRRRKQPFQNARAEIQVHAGCDHEQQEQRRARAPTDAATPSGRGRGGRVQRATAGQHLSAHRGGRAAVVVVAASQRGSYPCSLNESEAKCAELERRKLEIMLTRAPFSI